MFSLKDLYKFNTNFLKKNKDFNPGIQIFKIIESQKTGAYLTVGIIDKSTLILSFRGTELSIKDMLTDILIHKQEIPYNSKNNKIKVHFGFLNQYMSIRNDLFKLLRNKIFIKDIIIIGHSLGEVLSTLCIRDLKYNFKDFNLKGIIFGSPKVGNEYFKKDFDENVKDFTNIQNVNDLIPKVLLRIMGFEHVGNITKVDNPKFPYISIKKHLSYDEYL